MSYTKIKDTINQLLPNYGVADLIPQPLVHKLDPSMSGETRFCSRIGHPEVRIAPRISGELAEILNHSSSDMVLSDPALVDWLISGVLIQIAGGERVSVSSSEKLSDGTLRVTLSTPSIATYPLGTEVSVFSFPCEVISGNIGDGGVGNQPLKVISPFILIPSDTLTVQGKSHEVSTLDETVQDAQGKHYDCYLADTRGLLSPLPSTVTGSIVAKLAYASEILPLPTQSLQEGASISLQSPFAYDWVSGSLIEGYNPQKESRCWVRAYSSVIFSEPLDGLREIYKNDVENRMSISKGSLPIQQVIRGNTNWDGTNAILNAPNGIGHLRVNFTPPLPSLSPHLKTAEVPSGHPRRLFTSTSLSPSTLVIKRSSTKQEIKEIEQLSGSISVNTGTLTVIGIGTSFLADFSFGDSISVVGNTLIVASVITDTEIKLTQAYTGLSASGVIYNRVNYAASTSTSSVPLGTIEFTSSLTNVRVDMEYSSIISWFIQAHASVTNVNLNVKVGNNDVEIFALDTSTATLNITNTKTSSISHIDISCHNSDNSSSPIEVFLGNLTPQNTATPNGLKYFLTTASLKNHGWLSGGLLLKSLLSDIRDLSPILDSNGSITARINGQKIII